MPDITQILSQAKAREKSVYLCLAGDLIAEVDRLERQLGELSGDPWQPDSLAATNPAQKIAKQIKAVRDRMKKAETEFRFRALGDKKYSDLMAAHPAKTAEEAWDPQTFPKALVTACAIDPVMTEEQAEALFEILNEAQRHELMQAAYDVNNEATSIPFSVTASGILNSRTAGR